MRLHPAVGMPLQRVVPASGRVIGGRFLPLEHSLECHRWKSTSIPEHMGMMRQNGVQNDGSKVIEAKWRNTVQWYFFLFFNPCASQRLTFG